MTDIRDDLESIKAALQAVIDGLPVPDPDPIPEPPPPDPAPAPEEPDPVPLPGGGLDQVKDLAAGAWAEFGQPLLSIDPGRAALDGSPFGKVLTAWNGMARQGHECHAWGGGGHGDGWFNGVAVLDLLTGRWEMRAPHLPLNVPLMRVYDWNDDGTPKDAWYEPYRGTKPWPLGMNQSKAERLVNGPLVNEDGLAQDAEGNWTVPAEAAFGAFERPRGAHIYGNTVAWQGDLYRLDGQIAGSGKPWRQVWRCDPGAPGNTMTRLPDRWDAAGRGGKGDMPGTYNASFVKPDAGPYAARLLMFSGGSAFVVDLEAGIYEPMPSKIVLSEAKAMAAWDRWRQGIWVIDSQYQLLRFARVLDGIWQWDDSLKVNDDRFGAKVLGLAAVAAVPDGQGASVAYVRGDGSVIYRWDGVSLSEIPAPAASGVSHKWWYLEEERLLVGVWDPEKGAFAYRPAEVAGEVPEEPGEPDPDPEPQPEPSTAATAIEALTFSSFGGYRAAPAPWTPAAWSEPIRRHALAPDYEAIAPGPWAELHYSSDADLEVSKAQIIGLAKQGVQNLRIFLHGKAEPYVGRLEINNMKAVDIVGVPQDGRRPMLTADVAMDANSNLTIVRGIDLKGALATWGFNRTQNRYPQAAVYQDVTFGQVGPLMGDTPYEAHQTYLEFSGCVLGPNPDWHVLYLLQSIRQLVMEGCVAFGPGNSGHALKTLAQHAWIKGNVFSNVGLDGRPVASNDHGEIVGPHPLDLYLSTETEFEDNTVIFRTSGQVRSTIGYRSRAALWGNAYGRRLPGGGWEQWLPYVDQDGTLAPNLAYYDPALWQEIAASLEGVDSYEAARANPWAFASRNRGNTFIIIDHDGKGPGVAAHVKTLRPVAADPLKKPVVAVEGKALVSLCNGDEACWLANASPLLRYVYGHTDPANLQAIRKNADFPSHTNIPHPEGFVNRGLLFWERGQRAILCNADINQAFETELPLDDHPEPYDDAQLAAPPRVIFY